MSRSKPLTAIGAALAVAAFAILPASAAAAAPASSSSSSTGWVRVAHLSPDTKQVDLTLSSLSGGTVLYKLSDVGFGDVSPYMKLQPGTYAIAMVPAGSPSGTTPIVNASISVSAGKAETVAALGLNKDLTTKVIADSLDQPTGNDARVRVIQASVKHDSVTVSDGSSDLASDASFGSVGAYRTVGAGTSRFSITAGSTTATSTQDLAAGSVHTLIVLDNASGGLSMTSVLDSAATTVAPVGGIDTGGGALAARNTAAAETVAAPLAGVAAAGALVAMVLLARRPRRPRRVGAPAPRGS